MSVQYRDGSFSETMPFDEAVEEFQKALDLNTARALIVGTEDEIGQIKNRKALEDEIAELSARVTELEDGPIKSEKVIIPTRDEVLKALRKEL
jgi:exonuclease VII small subunit